MTEFEKEILQAEEIRNAYLANILDQLYYQNLNRYREKRNLSLRCPPEPDAWLLDAK